MQRSIRFSAAVFVVLLLLPGSAVLAQSADDVFRVQRDAQRQILEQQQRDVLRLQEIEAQTHKPGGANLERPVPSVGPKSDRCFQTERIVIEGATQLTDERRRTMLAPYSGHCLGLAQINALIRTITNDYIARGYTTTRAYVPEQDMSSGTLRILVLEGKVGRIRMEGSGIWLPGVFPGLEGEVFNLREFEQGVDQINRLQSNRATMDIEPGAEPGTSDVVVSNFPGRPWTLNFAADNTGSDSTGRIQASVTAGWDNPLGLNDYFNFSFRTNPEHDAERRLSETFSAFYSIPFGRWTLSLNASRFKYASIVKGRVIDFQSSGNSSNTGIKLDRIMYRDQSTKWLLYAGATAKDTESAINGEVIKSSSRTLGIADFGSNLNINSAIGLLSFDLGYSRGLKAFGAQVDADHLSREAPRAQFNKYTYGVNLFSFFKMSGQDFSYQSTISGQYAKDVLYGTEQTSIGSPFTVRGFRTQSLVGDSGVYWRNELGMPLPLGKALGEQAPYGQIKPFIGFDVGHVNNKYALDGGTLSSFTVGANLNVARLALQLAYSTPRVRPARFTDNSPYTYLRLAFDF